MTFVEEKARALSGADRDVSLLAKDQYFRELSWSESMSREEEDKLLRRVLRGNAERLHPCPNQWVLSLAKHARECLVEVYQPLVVSLARRYRFQIQSMELLDVIQEGNIGLLVALDRYDEEAARRYPFAIIAASRIKHAISDALVGTDAFIRLPYNKSLLVRRKSVVESALRKQFGRVPLLSEIAEIMDVSEEDLEQVLEEAKQREMGSLHEIIESREVDEDRMTFTGLYTAAVIDEDTRQAELAATFQCVFEEAMPPVQREILELRFGFGDMPGSMRSHEVVAEMLNVTSEAVSGNEKHAKKRLGRLLEPVILEDGRLSCVSKDLYSDDYCTSREAASLLGIGLTSVHTYARQGLLPFTMRPRRKSRGSQERVFRKADILAFRRGRGSAFLPSVVA